LVDRLSSNPTEQLVHRDVVTSTQLRKRFSRVLDSVRDGQHLKISFHGRLIALLDPSAEVETVRTLSRSKVLQTLQDFMLNLRQKGPALVVDERNPDDAGVAISASPQKELRLREDVSDEIRQFLTIVEGRTPEEVASALRLWDMSQTLRDRLPREEPTSPDITPSPSDFIRLSKAEREVCELLLKGWSYKEIAKPLGRSITTIRGAATRAFQKLGVRNKSEFYIHYINVRGP